MSLTPKTIAVLELIARWRRDYGCAPTLDEMAAVLNVSRVAVWERIDRLVESGHLKKQHYHSRSLTLTTLGRSALPGARCPTCGRVQDDETSDMEVTPNENDR